MLARYALLRYRALRRRRVVVLITDRESLNIVGDAVELIIGPELARCIVSLHIVAPVLHGIQAVLSIDGGHYSPVAVVETHLRPSIHELNGFVPCIPT